MNKKNILRASLASFAVASLLGLSAVLFEGGGGRVAAAAGVFGLMGISSFFVGLAYPKE